MCVVHHQTHYSFVAVVPVCVAVTAADGAVSAAAAVVVALLVLLLPSSETCAMLFEEAPAPCFPPWHAISCHLPPGIARLGLVRLPRASMERHAAYPTHTRSRALFFYPLTIHEDDDVHRDRSRRDGVALSGGRVRDGRQLLRRGCAPSFPPRLVQVSAETSGGEVCTEVCSRPFVIVFVFGRCSACELCRCFMRSCRWCRR